MYTVHEQCLQCTQVDCCPCDGQSLGNCKKQRCCIGWPHCHVLSTCVKAELGSGFSVAVLTMSDCDI